MAEGKKALNSSVSTLKKNRSRIDRLVKAAKFRIVPPKQYATGRSKDLLDDAVKQLKSKRGLNGVVGEGAGPFSDKALKKQAADKNDGAYAGAGAAVGAATGRAMARSYQKSTNTIRSNARTVKQILANKPSSKIRAETPIFDRRAAKTLKGAGRRGALIGAVSGAIAGLGVKQVKKEMEKKAAVSDKQKNQALAATAVGSGAALGAALTHDMKKNRVASRMGTKGAYKHMSNASVEGAEKRLASSAKTMRRMAKPLRRAGIKGGLVGAAIGAGLGAAQMKKDLVKEAGNILQTRTFKDRARQAAEHFAKRDARVANLKSNAKKAAGAAAIVGGGVAVTKKNEQLKKEAAQLVKKDGKKYREGTVASAATKTGIANAALRVIGGAKKPRAILDGAAKGALLGGAYGTVRGANRLRKGEISVSSKEMKGLKKKAAEMIVRDGKKYRKGNVSSATTTMAGVNAGMQLANNIAGMATAKKMGVPLPRSAILAKLPHTAAGGALMGYGYGKIREHYRKKRGEESVSHEKFKGLKKSAAEKIEVGGKKYRKGTVTSAATKMGILGAVTSGGYSAKYGGYVGPSAIRGALGGAVTGGAYALARKALRARRGEHSVSGSEFKDMKRMKRMKELMG